MTENNPAARLREAATVVRKYAADARLVSPPPWRVTEGDVVRCGDQRGAIVADRSDEPEWGAVDLPWIALMSPDIGEPLVAWLESEARYWEGVYTGQPMPGRNRFAFALADAILRGVTP